MALELLQALGVRHFSLHSGVSSSARANWRQTAQLLISNSGAIKEAADLSQVMLLIADSYEVNAKHGILTVPWNLAPVDLPSKMKDMLAAGGVAGGSPAAHGAGSSAARGCDSSMVYTTLAMDESGRAQGKSSPPPFEGAVSFMYVLTLLLFQLSNSASEGRKGGNRKETEGQSAAWRGIVGAASTAVAVTMAFIFGQWGPK